jgi:hypothetical protein
MHGAILRSLHGFLDIDGGVPASVHEARVASLFPLRIRRLSELVSALKSVRIPAAARQSRLDRKGGSQRNKDHPGRFGPEYAGRSVAGATAVRLASATSSTDIGVQRKKDPLELILLYQTTRTAKAGLLL